jgi:hypothetical protein
MKKAALAITGTLFGLLFLYYINDHIGLKKDVERKKLFSNVQKGMNEQDVRRLLGTPDTVYYAADSSSFEYRYFTKEYEGTLRAGIPSISFDRSGLVFFASFDE